MRWRRTPKRTSLSFSKMRVVASWKEAKIPRVDFRLKKRSGHCFSFVWWGSSGTRGVFTSDVEVAQAMLFRAPSTPVRPKPYRKNTIPVMISGVDEKFKSWRKLMGELRQYHPSLKISRIKELPKGDFIAVGDSMQDVIILQNESKMKAALGKNVKISVPKAFQTSKEQKKVFL